jgi:hypothetical protein
LSVATFITLLLVPVIYSIFVLDLKLVKWESCGFAKKSRVQEATASPPDVRQGSALPSGTY